MHQIANAIKFFSAAIEIYDQPELGSESRELEAKISKIKEENESIRNNLYYQMPNKIFRCPIFPSAIG